MAKPHGSVRIGPISLFALIIILCLAVLAVLSLSTSMAELNISERQAQTTTETYQLESVGQTFVADVDAALVEGTLDEVLPAWGVADDSPGVVRDPLVTCSGTYDGSLITATFSVESGRQLACVLRINTDKTYTIEQWKVTTQWLDDGTGETLWLG